MQVECLKGGKRELQGLTTGAMFKLLHGGTIYIKVADTTGHIPFKIPVVSLPNAWLYQFEYDRQVIEYDGKLSVWPKDC